MARSVHRSSGCESCSRAVSVLTSDTSPGRPQIWSRPGWSTGSSASFRSCIAAGWTTSAAPALPPRGTVPGTRWTRLRTKRIHLARLVAGSEGTLALVSQAMLRTIPLPGAQAVVLLPFHRLSQAAAFAPGLLGSKWPPSSCDLLDRRSLRLARDADRLLRDVVGDAAESAPDGGIRSGRFVTGGRAGPNGDGEGRAHGMVGRCASDVLEAGRLRSPPWAGVGRSRAG